MKKIKFIMAPRPGKNGGPDISMLRLERALISRGHKPCNHTFFRIFGGLYDKWDYSIIMGLPHHYNYFFRYKKPIILIMGKPENEIESLANNRIYTKKDDVHAEKCYELMQKVDYVVFISNYVKNIWNQWAINKNKILLNTPSKVIYHGVDLNLFKPEHRKKNFFFTIGCFGNLRTKNRIESIFEVSKRLNFEHKFHIVGKASDECEKIISLLSSNPSFKGSIKRTNWVSQNDLPNLYNSIDCLLHPVDYEGFGIVISEAMACGIPVVAPNHGGAGEIVGSGGVLVNTVQFKYNNFFYDCLADGVKKVFNNKNFYSKRARLEAIEKFNIENISKDFINIYEKIS